MNARGMKGECEKWFCKCREVKTCHEQEHDSFKFYPCYVQLSTSKAYIVCTTNKHQIIQKSQLPLVIPVSGFMKGKKNFLSRKLLTSKLLRKLSYMLKVEWVEVGGLRCVFREMEICGIKLNVWDMMLSLLVNMKPYTK